jgi:hypothetical protein
MKFPCIEGAIPLRSLPHPIAQRAANGAEPHHERPNGSRCPNALNRNNVPRPARMVAVADVCDALSTQNAVCRSMPIRAAYRHFKSHSGTLLDADSVRALVPPHESIQRNVSVATGQPSSCLGLCNPMLANRSHAADSFSGTFRSKARANRSLNGGHTPFVSHTGDLHHGRTRTT